MRIFQFLSATRAFRLNQKHKTNSGYKYNDKAHFTFDLTFRMLQRTSSEVTIEQIQREQSLISYIRSLKLDGIISNNTFQKNDNTLRLDPWYTSRSFKGLQTRLPFSSNRLLHEHI